MSEHTIKLAMNRSVAALILTAAINDPEWLMDMLYAEFQQRVSGWSEHGWDLRAVAGVDHIYVTARRKT